MDHAVRTSLLFIAFVLAAWVLYWLRDILAPFALAIFFWLIIDGFTRWLASKTPLIPHLAALIVAFLIVGASLFGIGVVITDTALDIAREAPHYEKRLSEIVSPFVKRFSGDGSLSDFWTRSVCVTGCNTYWVGWPDRYRGSCRALSLSAFMWCSCLRHRLRFQKR